MSDETVNLPSSVAWDRPAPLPEGDTFGVVLKGTAGARQSIVNRIGGYRDERSGAEVERDELRAILTPLLDFPWVLVPGDADHIDSFECRICGARDIGALTHTPTCAVHDKARLLGRS